ncbi:MAG: tetratricopeptide repeat protein, partial [Proteobacteria bacterium]|nr:tetratricopeptide repeat protein [Pseudomonadota bacterium]
MLDRAIIVALGLAVSYFVFDKLVLDPVEDERIAQQARSEALADSYGDNSIAVLPFVNRSSDVEQQYFSDGLAEELLNLLTAVPELRVTSRSSSFLFRDDSVDIEEAARKLNVAHILEGSVRRSGGRIRVTAQLVGARTNSALWSEVYEREIDDVFAIQDDIAASVVSGLQLTILGRVPRSDPVDPEAYSLFLQARHLEYRNSPEAWDRAIELYQQALTIEPEYAEALAGLAASIRDQSSRTAGSMAIAEGLERAAQLANRALEINPNLAIAYSALGDIASASRDFRGAADHYAKALSLTPTDPGVLLESASLITNLGRAEEGVRIQEYLVERDPLNPRAYWLLGYAYETVGRWRDARDAFETALVLSPEMGVVRMAIGLTYLEQDKPEPLKALESIEQDNNKVWKLVGLTLAHHALGNAAESDAALQSLIDDYADEAAYNIGAAYAYRGDVDEAFEW